MPLLDLEGQWCDCRYQQDYAVLVAIVAQVNEAQKLVGLLQFGDQFSVYLTQASMVEILTKMQPGNLKLHS